VPSPGFNPDLRLPLLFWPIIPIFQKVIFFRNVLYIDPWSFTCAKHDHYLLLGYGRAAGSDTLVFPLPGQILPSPCCRVRYSPLPAAGSDTPLFPLPGQIRPSSRCRVRYSRLPAAGSDTRFNQLRLGAEHHMRDSNIAPGWGSVNLSQFTHNPLDIGYSYREGKGGSLTTLEWPWPFSTGWDLHFTRLIGSQSSNSPYPVGEVPWSPEGQFSVLLSVNGDWLTLVRCQQASLLAD